MKLTDIPIEGYEKVVRCDDPALGFKAFIAVHDTTLGPALGGVRMWPYSSEQEAFADVIRLAQGMTYKSALAATGLGGGKAVVMGHPSTDKSVPLLRLFGRFVDALDGLYIAAEDVGTTEADMSVIREETSHVTGLSRAHGSSGNPAWFTALGVFLGMRVCLERTWRTDHFTGSRIAVQGCGNVANHLCQFLHEDGAELIVADVDSEKAEHVAERYGAQVVTPDKIHRVACDIYSPCALGGTLDALTIPQLTCAIVAGSANNQCSSPEDSDLLRKRGILYAPDFVVNAGGVINIAVGLEATGYDEGHAVARVRHIAVTLREIFELADAQRVATERAAIMLAERRLAAVREAKREER